MVEATNPPQFHSPFKQENACIGLPHTVPLEKPWQPNTSQSQIAHFNAIFRSKSTGTNAPTITTTSFGTVPRRLSSGSACETCRRRKTKCDGGQPCAFCASNRIECVHRASRRRRSPVSLASLSSTKKMQEDDGDKQLQWMEPLLTRSATVPDYRGQIGYLQRPLTPEGQDDSSKPKTTSHRYLQELDKTSLSKQASCPSLTSGWKNQPSSHFHPRASYAGAPTRKDDLSFVTKEEIPSMMDQLSCRTFSAVTLAAIDHQTSYPIYPLLSPPQTNAYASSFSS